MTRNQPNDSHPRVALPTFVFMFGFETCTNWNYRPAEVFQRFWYRTGLVSNNTKTGKDKTVQNRALQDPPQPHRDRRGLSPGVFGQSYDSY